MHFGSKARNVNCVHSKGRQMFRERARSHYADMKKDMEHELTLNQSNISKCLNDHYEYLRTNQHRGSYMVKFKNPDTNQIKNVKFDYEENYTKLKDTWSEHD